MSGICQLFCHVMTLRIWRSPLPHELIVHTSRVGTKVNSVTRQDGKILIVEWELHLFHILISYASCIALLESKPEIPTRTGWRAIPTSWAMVCGNWSRNQVRIQRAKRWKACAYDSKRKLNVRPEENRCSVVYDIVWMLEILSGYWESGDDPGNANGNNAVCSQYCEDLIGVRERTLHPTWTCQLQPSFVLALVWCSWPLGLATPI